LSAKSTGIKSGGGRIALNIMMAATLSIFASACSPGGECVNDPDIESNAVDFGSDEPLVDEGDVAATEDEAKLD
jgi:hypothetical protein